MQVKEEAIWSITNLSLMSQYYEERFNIAAHALLEIVKVERIDNLAALLNLKE